MARHGIARHGAARHPWLASNARSVEEGEVHCGIDAEVCVEHPELAKAHKVVRGGGSALEGLWGGAVVRWCGGSRGGRSGGAPAASSFKLACILRMVIGKTFNIYLSFLVVHNVLRIVERANVAASESEARVRLRGRG